MTPCFAATCVDRIGDAGMERADEDRAVLARDEALGDAAPGGGVRLRVGRDPLNLAPEHAAVGVELVDRHADSAQIVLAGVAVLAARVARQAELDRLSLSVGAVV